MPRHTKFLLTAALACAIAGCATTGSKSLDVDLMNSVVVENETLGATVIDRFGTPTQTLDIEGYRLLGYRRVDSTMSPWTIVPVVGLVAGGVNNRITTCVVRVATADDVVQSLKCGYAEDFQYNLETATGQIKSEDEWLNIFNKSLE